MRQDIYHMYKVAVNIMYSQEPMRHPFDYLGAAILIGQVNEKLTVRYY